MKILRCGDPHITPRNLKDSENLIDFILKIARENNVDRIEFLGDLFHTHAVVRVEVLDFWRKAFAKLNEFRIFCLVGNHDQPGSREKEQEMNSLSVFKESEFNLSIIDEPTCEMGIAYIPYMSDHGAFLKAANNYVEENTLIAHQTFTGATYENGFYSEEGIDPALIPQKFIISGHIHKQQQVGKCFYPGTPKWDTMSDANEDKGIWIFEHANDGSVINKTFYSTKDIVTPIYKYVINEGDEDNLLLDKNARNYIELHGKTAWINKLKKKYKGLASIKAKPTDRKMPRLDSEKTLSLIEYLEKSFEPIDGVTKNDMNNYLKEISNV